MESLICWWILVVCLGVSTMQCNLDQRTNVKFLVGLGHTPIQIWRQLHDVYGDDTMSKPTVCRWVLRFKEGDGHTPVTDMLRSRRPRTKMTTLNINMISDMIQRDRRLTLKELSARSGLSKTTVVRIVKKKLDLNRINAKFIPKLLTDEQKQMRVHLCEENLRTYTQEKHFLAKVVTGDESWVRVYEPELKSRSSQWMAKGSRHPQKAKRGRSERKTMLTVFFDSDDVIHSEFSDATVDTDSYIQTINTLKERIRQKRPELWHDRRFILHQDNAPSHTSNRTIAHLSHPDNPIRLLPHPPYSPDLAPCDYFLFPYLKAQLRGHRFQNVQDLRTAVQRELWAIPPQKLARAIADLPSRWRKCVAAEGNFFEGQHYVVDTDTEFEYLSDSSDDTDSNSD